MRVIFGHGEKVLTSLDGGPGPLVAASLGNRLGEKKRKKNIFNQVKAAKRH